MITIIAHIIFWPALAWNIIYWTILLFNLNRYTIKEDLTDGMISLAFLLVPGIYLFGVL